MVIKYFLHEIHKFKESKLRENISKDTLEENSGYDKDTCVHLENNVAVRNFSCLIHCIVNSE